MKYLKTYENFGEQDLGRFSKDEMDMNEPENNIQEFDDEEYYDEFDDDYREDDRNNDDEDNYDEDGNLIDKEEDYRAEDRKLWGDEIMVESRKKLKDKKDDKCGPKCKCKEIPKKGDKCGSDCKCKDKKEDKKEDKEKPKGLTAAQKKLPKALQDSILKRQK